MCDISVSHLGVLISIVVWEKLSFHYHCLKAVNAPQNQAPPLLYNVAHFCAFWRMGLISLPLTFTIFSYTQSITRVIMFFSLESFQYWEKAQYYDFSRLFWSEHILPFAFEGNLWYKAFQDSATQMEILVRARALSPGTGGFRLLCAHSLTALFRANYFICASHGDCICKMQKSRVPTSMDWTEQSRTSVPGTTLSQLVICSCY